MVQKRNQEKFHNQGAGPFEETFFGSVVHMIGDRIKRDTSYLESSIEDLCMLCSKIIMIILESIQEMHQFQHFQEFFSERIQTK